MFRQRGSAYSRQAGSAYSWQARRRRAWFTWLVALAGCGVVVLAVHFATAPSTLAAVNSAHIGQARHFQPHGGPADHPGYGHGGYPMMPHAPQEAATTTKNWAGYAETGATGKFTSVSSSWTQPTVTCDTADTFSSFWVGLDGEGTPTVEQVGTEADCANGTAVYGGWYEIFPNAPVFYKDPVQPGDAMSASVVANGGGSFTLTLSDATQNWTRTTKQMVPQAELGSAEIIAEAPSSQAVLPLANFGTVNFTDVTVNGQGLTDDPIALTLVSADGTTEAKPSALDGQGDFSVTWDGSGSTDPTTETGSPGTTGTAPGTTATGPGTTGTGPGTTGTGHHHHHHRNGGQG
jgi:hypothetical protein